MNEQDYQLLEQFVLTRDLTGVNGKAFARIIEILEELKGNIKKE